uniref:Uncharacterized protein n=1 Tax=Pyxicephalus adspersus TaxID=30357 RepID=A0AAV2ZVW4_PYXAD|nr:TPA: hypothetical protein GDO54_017628 [Pyxicephalus adspersus]
MVEGKCPVFGPYLTFTLVVLAVPHCRESLYLFLEFRSKECFKASLEPYCKCSNQSRSAFLNLGIARGSLGNRQSVPLRSIELTPMVFSAICKDDNIPTDQRINKENIAAVP